MSWITIALKRAIVSGCYQLWVNNGLWVLSMDPGHQLSLAVGSWTGDCLTGDFSSTHFIYLTEITFICHLNQSSMIAIIFCTCHNGSAVVTCAKFCSNYWNMVSIRAKGNNFSGWIMSAKYSVKWSRGDVNWQWFLRPLISPQTPPGRDNKVEHALVSKLLKSKRMGKKIWGFIWGSLMLIFQFQFGHIEKLLYFQNGSFQTWSSRDERMNACTLVLS